MMAEAMKAEGLTLTHLIGPEAPATRYQPETQEGDQPPHRPPRRAAAETGCRADVQFTTYTLRYNRSFWVTVDGLGKHWERADVDAQRTTPGRPSSSWRRRTSRR